MSISCFLIDIDPIFKISKIFARRIFIIFRCPSFPNLVPNLEISDFPKFEIYKSPPAPACHLPGAPRLREPGPLSFYQLAVIAFQAIRLCSYVFRGPMICPTKSPT